MEPELIVFAIVSILIGGGLGFGLAVILDDEPENITVIQKEIEYVDKPTTVEVKVPISYLDNQTAYIDLTDDKYEDLTNYANLTNSSLFNYTNIPLYTNFTLNLTELLGIYAATENLSSNLTECKDSLNLSEVKVLALEIEINETLETPFDEMNLTEVQRVAVCDLLNVSTVGGSSPSSCADLWS